MCYHAFDAGRNTFTQAYGSTALDDSLLLIPRLGFLPGTDRRGMGTSGAVRANSAKATSSALSGPARPTTVKGSEGLFIPCSFWLVDALHASGRRETQSTCSNACSWCATTSGC